MMKILVCGTRGFPDIQGGIETHCEELYPRIANSEFEVIVARRSPYVAKNAPQTYQGVKFKDINVPKITGLESALHTFLSIVYAWKIKADIVHIHGVGPSIAIPVAKILGLKTVVTHHGPDYERKKWGTLAKCIIKTGERFAARYADEIIIISSLIGDILKNKYHRTDHVHLIYNGVNIPNRIESTDYLDSLNIIPNKYLLAVGRFVEEKNFDFLIDAYKQSDIHTKYQLAIAGDSDIETAYSLKLKAKAKANGIILTGMIKGKKLAELYSNAALFVLPSSHEGLPITLLEAMSYKRKVIASNIPANLSVGLDNDSYFELANREDLKNKIVKQLQNDEIERTYDLSIYNWDTIASETINVYKNI
jgi:glycosyltransferase involved in cell wall biosynthesis